MWSEADSAGRHALSGLRVVVTGAGGQLGGYLVPALHDSGAAVVGFGSRPGRGVDVAFDLADDAATMREMANARPDVVIHAAACTDVDGIEREPQRGERSNVRATQNVALAARECGAYMLTVSTDMVFSGDGGAPYAEDGRTGPISEYGRSKLEAESAVLNAGGGNGVARTAWLYGGPGKHFPRTVLTVLRDRGRIDVVSDEFGSPTFAGDLAMALVNLAAVRGAGIFHLANEGRASRFGLAQETARLSGFDPEQVRPVTTEAFLARYPLPARRPADSTLLNRRALALGVELRGWREAIAAYAPTLAAELGRSKAANAATEG